MAEKSPFDENKTVEIEPIRPAPVAPRQAPRGQNYAPAKPARRPRSRSVFWPIVLIGLGVLIMLYNFGFLSTTGWAALWQLWPLALIALGIDVLIGRRSAGGAIASVVLILVLLGVAIGIAFFADNLPWIAEWLEPAEMHYERVEYPVSGLESAKIYIDWTSAPGYLSALDDSDNLIEAEVAYRGELDFGVNARNGHADVELESYLQGISYGNFNFDDREAEWDVQLSPDVALDLRLDGGSGYGDFDLSDLDISNLDLDVGSGKIELILPEDSSFSGKIEGGSGVLTIVLPKGVGARVDLESGSGAFRAGDRFVLVSGDPGDDSLWESENYDDADVQIELEIDQGSGEVRIR